MIRTTFASFGLGALLIFAVAVDSPAFGVDKQTTTVTTFKYNDRGKTTTNKPARKLTGKKRPARRGQQEVEYLKQEKWR